MVSGPGLSLNTNKHVFDCVRTVDSRLLMLYIAVIAFVVLLVTIIGSFMFARYCLMRRPPKSIVVVAKKTYMLKKTIILEYPKAKDDYYNSDPSKAPLYDEGWKGGKDIDVGYFLTPMITIKSERIETDLSSDDLACYGNNTKYELPLDAEWELDRSK